MQLLINDNDQAHFIDHGYVVLENILDENLLALARVKCDAAVAFQEKQMRNASKIDDGINLLDRRYFISGYSKIDSQLNCLLFSDLMADICVATIGNTAYLLNEQFVVKMHDPQSVFAWHQDSGYGIYRSDAGSHTPYVTCWIALDDMTEANGTVSILPFERAGGSTLVEHVWNESEAALVGYEGNDSGVLIEISAGSVVCFSSVALHRSGPNTTDKVRRSYIVQYTPMPFNYSSEPDRPYETKIGQAVPFLRDGIRVDRQ